MFNHKPLLQSFYIFIFAAVLLTAGCISPKDKVDRATLLKTEHATQEFLLAEVNRFSKVGSMRAKMDLKFEDNSYAELGIAEKYKSADGEVVVQRPSNILLKVQVPIIKSDVAQMSSNGEKFCVAVLQDGAGGKYKKFVCGSNNADYSALREEVENIGNGDAKALKQNINAFASLRPQHFTEAILVRPIDKTNNFYTQSAIHQEEFDIKAQKKSPLRWVLRGYYLLDELHKNENGLLTISRRFWFDRVGGIRLARQQIFDAKGEIESDIVYGMPGNLTDTGEYNNLPLRIEVTRPKEKYKMSLTYQTPDTVLIGRTFPVAAFELKNTWGLEEVNLDEKLQEVKSRSNTSATPVKNEKSQ